MIRKFQKLIHKIKIIYKNRKIQNHIDDEVQ